jgi:hypothetical protein
MEDWYYLEGKNLEQKCQGSGKYLATPGGMENGPFFTKDQLYAMKHVPSCESPRDPVNSCKKSRTRANSSMSEPHTGDFERKYYITSHNRSHNESVLSGTPRKDHPLSQYARSALNYADLEGEMQLERTKSLNLQ